MQNWFHGNPTLDRIAQSSNHSVANLIKKHFWQSYMTFELFREITFFTMHTVNWFHEKIFKWEKIFVIPQN